ncbi:MAG: UDP-3-O-(3-hydroxymyristoyl)glucosamine N-acyltransferase [Rhizobiaceae bacterium]|nr:UDP-3-O-(3-hydroxymyristoyl)glucosamine N-acyltransferase [Rhizobiaceae bacterium]
MSNPGFFAPLSPLSASDIADHTGAFLKVGSGSDTQIHTTAPIESAQKGALTFLDNSKYLEYLATTSASLVICSKQHAALAPDHLSILVHPEPYLAYAKALNLLFPTAMRPQPVTEEVAVSSEAHLAKSAVCEENVIIEPGCVIGRNVSIGEGSHILAGSVIGPNVQIGRNCTIAPRVVVSHTLMGDNVIVHSGASIGQDGFGFVMKRDGHTKIAQVGRVIIQDSVEIGANTTIDRGANRDTIIGEGSKIDNLVQIAHNVVLGRHCIIVGLVGISGSTTLGDFVVVAGQAGIIGHLTIGHGAQIGGGSGVHRDLDPGEKVMGYPSIPADFWMRQAAKSVKDAKKWQSTRKRGKHE